MSTLGNWFIILSVSAPVLLAIAYLALEPGRKRRVLTALGRDDGWMRGLDVARQAGVWVTYVTLASLEEEGLVERQTFDDPAGPDRGFLPRTRYRLTDKGRTAAAKKAA